MRITVDVLGSGRSRAEGYVAATPYRQFRSIIHLLFTGRGNARIPVAVLQTRSFRERSNLDRVKEILNKEKTEDESHSVGT